MLFYDFEVFKHDWLVVIKDAKERVTHRIVNDANALLAFYRKHESNIWIGYNTRHYDQWIMKGILCGFDPYEVSCHIIEKGQGGWSFSSRFHEIQFYNFDIMTSMHSLKQLEGFMGNSIQESSVPFTIDRKLTEDEIEEVFGYCDHDVNQTMHVYVNRKDEFQSQVDMMKEFNLDPAYFSKTKVQLSSMILGAVKVQRADEFDISFPTTMEIKKYQHIVDWYRNKDNMFYKHANGRANQLIVDVAGVPHVFGWGGLHGAIPNYSGTGIYINMDVGSYYPALMIEYNYLSRNVLDPEKFKRIRDMRLELKKVKDNRQGVYKIIINGTYGAMKDQYNNLYDPLQANNVCVAGQLLLLDLIEHLEPYCQLIQSNTDGILVKVDSMDDVPKIKEIAGEWEKRVFMDLEFDILTKVVQKDVNNYLTVDDKGKVKSKGAYVKAWQKKNAKGDIVEDYLDYDCVILREAVVNYFRKGVPVEETINGCNELIKFQKISKIGSTYKYTTYGEDKLHERVLRVFASNREDAKGVFKVKTEGNFEKIGNTPEKCFIDNSNINGKPVPSYLDRQWYIDVAKERIDSFIKPKTRGKKAVKI